MVAKHSIDYIFNLNRLLVNLRVLFPKLCELRQRLPPFSKYFSSEYLNKSYVGFSST